MFKSLWREFFLRKNLARRPSPEVWAEPGKADSSMQRSIGHPRHDNAVDAARRLSESSPDSADARVSWGKSLAAVGRWGEASRQLETALALFPVSEPVSLPGLINARLSLADCRIRLNQNAQALVLLDETARLLPPALAERDFQRRMAELYFSLGEYSEAEKYLRICLGGQPESAELLLELGVVLHRQKKYITAARFAVSALQQNPALPGISATLYALFKDLSATTDASPLSGEPVDFIELFACANDSLREGNFPEAEHYFTQSRGAEPGWPFTYQRLGCLAALRGDLEQADAYFMQSAASGLLPDTNIRLAETFFDRLPIVSPRIDWGDAWRDTDSSPVIFVSGDPVYFRKFAHALLKSAEVNGNPDLLWHFHLINPDHWIHGEFEELQRSFPRFDLRFTSETRDFSSQEEAKTYYACARFVLLPELLGRYGCPLLLLDFDLLILAPLSPLVESMAPHDLALVRWDARHWEIWDQFWASAVLAYPAERSIAFFRCVAGYVEHFLQAGKSTWFLDQIALFSVAQRFERLQAVDIGAIPSGVCAMHHVSGASAIRPEIVFWSITHNIKANAVALESHLFQRYLPRKRKALGWTVPGEDQFFQAHLAKSPVFEGRKTWEFHIMELCRAHFGRRRRALDIGAHVGFWSYWLATQFQAVDAFEPTPILQECFAINVSSPAVTLHRCALGAAHGRAEVRLDSSNSGMTHISLSNAGAFDVKPLDEFGYTDIDFIKLDAEGYELFVLQGGVQTLLRNRPLILVEQDERWAERYGVMPSACVDMLRSLGAHVVAELPESNYLLSWSI